MFSKLKLAAFLLPMLLITSAPSMAASTTFCSDNSTQNTTSDQFIFNGSSTSHFIITENTTCQTGCSVMMNSCRPTQFDQSLLLLGLIVLLVVVMIVAVYLSRDIPYLEVGIGAAVGVVSFVIGLTDVFSNGYGYVFFALGILFLFMSVLLIFQRRQERGS